MTIDIDFDQGDRKEKPVSLSVAIIAETESGGVVMVRQSKNNEWGLIAGRIKERPESLKNESRKIERRIETFYEASLREMWEEGNLATNEVDELAMWGAPYVRGKDKDKFGIVFKTKVRVPDKTINSKKPNDPAIAEIRVFSLEEIIDLIFLNDKLIYKPEYNLGNLINWVFEKIQERKLAGKNTVEQYLPSNLSALETAVANGYW